MFHAIEKRQWIPASEAFESGMKTFQKEAGGHLFYGLFQPYVLSCLEDRQFAAAKDALKWTKVFEAKTGSILANGLAELDADFKRRTTR